VVGLINGSNALVNRYKYTPFGSSEGLREQVENNLRFGARELDVETGLYYNRARYYDPGLGRFISEDPAGFSSGANLYAYASNDPLNRRDPMGLADDCTTIDVTITKESGDVEETQVSICKGGGSTLGQILDFAETVGVGRGSYYWGGGMFATPAAVAAHYAGAGSPGCPGLLVGQCRTVVGGIIHLLQHDSNECVSFGREANAMLGAGRIRYVNRGFSGNYNRADDVVELGRHAFMVTEVVSAENLYAAMGGSLVHEIGHRRNPNARGPETLGQGNTPHDKLYQTAFACAGFNYAR